MPRSIAPPLVSGTPPEGRAFPPLPSAGFRQTCLTPTSRTHGVHRKSLRPKALGRQAAMDPKPLGQVCSLPPRDYAGLSNTR